ncbi:MAG: alpha/beta hydrolase [Anaerolinea sp.]|nr:alpha/beta hydrolase [Anaerolinea sp.]
MSLIDTARAPIWIADGRQADQPVVLLVHGATGSRLDWSGEMRHLRAGVITVDLPGHGKSPAPGRTSVGDYAADLIALLDALKLDKAVIIGHSMGGAIALQLALDHADRVRGIGLIGTGARLPVHPDILNNALTDQAAAARLISNWFWGEGATDAQREASFAGVMQTPPEIMHGDFLSCVGFDVRARLGEIRVPALIVAGEQDKMMPLKFSHLLHDNIAGSTLVIVPNAGHKLIIEQPQVVADAVQTWLDQLP